MNKKKTFEARQAKCGYLFTLPFLLGSVFFIAFPVVLSIVFSLSRVSNDVAGYTVTLNGFANYKYMLFSDPSYNKTVLSTLRAMLINVPIVAIFSFFIASMLNQEFHGRGFARSILFLPLIVSSAAVTQLLSHETVANGMESSAGEVSSGADLSGALVSYLSQINVGSEITGLLQSTVNNISAVLAMSAIPIIIFLAGLQAISPSIYEASYVEGATKWEVFWKISLPMISPMILVVVVYTMIDSFSSTTNAVIEIVHNLCFTGNIDLGNGCAAAWIYLVIVLAIMSAVYAVINRFVFYYDD